MSGCGKKNIKFYLVILCLFFIVSSATSCKNKEKDVPANQNRTKDETTDPCSPYDPPKPDYSRPGRRLSEIKCREYVWELKNRYERILRHEECMTIRRNAKTDNPNDYEFGIFFATGGRDTEPGEFPHMGAIGWKAAIGTWVFKCGSSLISPKFVLTAGHCSRVSEGDSTVADPVPKIVRLGDKNVIDVYANDVPPTDEKIINIIVHPLYHPPMQYNDIALMELEHYVIFGSLIQPACLWPIYDTSSLGPKATVTGWGVVETVHRTTSPELQAAEVDFIDTTVCNNLLLTSHNRNFNGAIDSLQLCAGKLAGGIDACEGDSGGPLQVKIPLPITSEGNMHYIVGVTAFGIGCGLPNLPGIYSRVSTYLNWIESIVWRE